MRDYAPDLSKITPGQTISKFSEFCKLLNIEVEKGGRNLAIQKKHLLRFVKYVINQDTKEVLIVSIPETPEPIKDGRSKGNNSKYIDYAAPLLLNLIYRRSKKTKNDYISFSKDEIQTSIGLCNVFFSRKIFNEPNIELDKYEVNNFNLRVRSMLSDIIDNSLSKLVKKENIKGFSKNLFIVDKNNLREATEEEISIHNKIKQDVLKKMGFTSEVHVHQKHQSQNFYNQVNKEMLENLEDCSNCFYLLKICFNLEDLKDEDCLLSDENIQITKNNLNNLIKISIEKNLKNKFQKEIKARVLCQRCQERLKVNINPKEPWSPYVCFQCMATEFIFTKENLENQINLIDYFINIDSAPSCENEVVLGEY
jgi:hypothetical protein